MIDSFSAYLKELNHKRIRAQRIRRVLRTDIPKRLDIENPGNQAKRILFVDALWGLGDALYVNGLASALAKSGKDVYVATLNRTLTVYQYNRDLKRVFSLEDEKDLEVCANVSFDCAIDLSYVGLDRWDIRMNLLRRLHTFCWTCTELAKDAKVFHRYIDLTKFAHVSERMAAIFNAVCPEQLPLERIGPVVSLPDTSLCDMLGRRYVYINTVAGEDDRCMTNKQVDALREWFESQDYYIGYFYIPGEYNLEEGETVKQVKGNFIDALKLVRQCDMVITPDTAIVHVASAFGIPTLALFCGGEMDYFKKFPMSDMWAPLASPSLSLWVDVEKHDKTKKVKPIPVGKIQSHSIISSLELLLSRMESNQPQFLLNRQNAL